MFWNKSKFEFNKQYKKYRNELNDKWKNYINDSFLNWSDKSLRLKDYLKFKELWNDYLQGYIREFGVDFDFEELKNEFENNFLKKLKSTL